LSNLCNSRHFEKGKKDEREWICANSLYL
jgi:hypothetical protein